MTLTVRIPSTQARRDAGSSSAIPTPAPTPLETLKNYLREMLRALLKVIEDSPNDESVGHPLLRTKGAYQSVQDLKSQINGFWKGDYPFRVDKRGDIHDPLRYWQGLAMHDSADVLGVSCSPSCSTTYKSLMESNANQILGIKIFSILVNSMPDERTNSTITWLNSPIRGNQKTRTLIDMIQVGQWYGKHAAGISKVSLLHAALFEIASHLYSSQKPEQHYRPAVKFRKIDKETLARLQTKSDEEERIEKELDIEEDTDNDSDSAQSDDKESDSLPKITFAVNPHINLKARALLDLISETDKYEDGQAEIAVLNAHPKSREGVSEMTVEDAFADWD